MSFRLTRQERADMVERTKRDINGSYAFAFSPPRIQQLCGVITGLDRLAACRVAGEIDNAIGSNATEKLLFALGCCPRVDHDKRKRAAKIKTCKLKRQT